MDLYHLTILDFSGIRVQQTVKNPWFVDFNTLNVAKFQNFMVPSLEALTSFFCSSKKTNGCLSKDELCPLSSATS